MKIVNFGKPTTNEKMFVKAKKKYIWRTVYIDGKTKKSWYGLHFYLNIFSFTICYKINEIK